MADKTPIDELANDLAILLLAEWIAIDHGGTRLQADKYMEKAQSLADYLQVIGWQHLNTKALIEKGRQMGIREMAEAYDNMLDGMGKGIDNFKKSDWEAVQALKQKYEVSDGR